MARARTQFFPTQQTQQTQQILQTQYPNFGQAHPAQPRRRIALSQNFLRDRRVAERIVALSGIGRDDVVYEIGPGEGIITAALAAHGRHVVAVEKDGVLAERLRRRFAGTPNVTVYEADFLTFPLPVTRYKVFASVPFSVTAAIVSKLTATPHPPEDCYLGVQREAAERFTGLPEECLASVLLKPWFEPSVAHRFVRQDFLPEPGVDVVLLRLRKRGPPLIPDEQAQAQLYRDIVCHGFTAWKPTLRQAYAGLLDARAERHLRERGVRLDVTPRRLPFEHWLELFHCFSAQAAASVRDRVTGAEDRLRRQQAALNKTHRTRKTEARSGTVPWPG